MPDSSRWHLAGAGNLGTLAAWYLSQAGGCVTVIDSRATADHPNVCHKRLSFADGRADVDLALARLPATAIRAPIERLILACKTPFNRQVLESLPLADDVTLIRLQNGMDDLAGMLPARARRIEAVTTTAARRLAPGHHLVVAENLTAMGGTGTAPGWFAALQNCWPNLSWSDDIRHRQYAKLVANVALNPLTALYDIDNGVLLTNPERRAQMRTLVAEADAVLESIDANWHGQSLEAVEAIIRQTAANTSSMRADLLAGHQTEIETLNGWLLMQAAQHGIDLPAHRDIVARIRARQPIPRTR